MVEVEFCCFNQPYFIYHIYFIGCFVIFFMNLSSKFS